MLICYQKLYRGRNREEGRLIGLVSMEPWQRMLMAETYAKLTIWMLYQVRHLAINKRKSGKKPRLKKMIQEFLIIKCSDKKRKLFQSKWISAK